MWAKKYIDRQHMHLKQNPSCRKIDNTQTYNNLKQHFLWNLDFEHK